MITKLCDRVQLSIYSTRLTEPTSSH